MNARPDIPAPAIIIVFPAKKCAFIFPQSCCFDATQVLLSSCTDCASFWPKFVLQIRCVFLSFFLPGFLYLLLAIPRESEKPLVKPR